AAHGDLRGLIGEVILPRELGNDGPLQLGDAVDRRVFGFAALNGGDGSLLDVVRGVEVWLAGAKANDVEAGGLHLARLDRNGHSRRGFYPLKRVGDETHAVLLKLAEGPRKCCLTRGAP